MLCISKENMLQQTSLVPAIIILCGSAASDAVLQGIIAIQIKIK